MGIEKVVVTFIGRKAAPCLRQAIGRIRNYIRHWGYIEKNTTSSSKHPDPLAGKKKYAQILPNTAPVGHARSRSIAKAYTHLLHGRVSVVKTVNH